MIRFYFILFFSISLITSCNYTKRVNSGQSAYDSKQYSVAVELLEKEFYDESDKPTKARKAYLIARSYSFMNDYINSRDWYQNAVDLDYGINANMALANSHKLNKNYDLAIEVYKKIEQKNGASNETTREINICTQALNWLAPDPSYDISVKTFRYSSEYADYAPVPYEDEYVVFSSDRMISTGDTDYKWTGNRFSDIYIASKKGGEVRLFGAGVNTSHNEATMAFNKDFTEIFFTRCYSGDDDLGNDYCRILYSSFQDGSWTIPEPLSFQDTLINYGQPALIENDSVLIFTSQMEDGYGGHDLYYSVREEGGWSEALLMPSSINTQGNEKFPSSDGDTLYFSSDYLPGLGGLDIFKTYLLDNGRWAPPKNMKYPFNSSTDDFGLVIDRSNPLSANIVKGYFSSSRNYETDDDIFEFTISPRKKQLLETPQEEVKEIANLTIYLAIKAVYNVYEELDNPSSKLMGKEALGNCTIELTNGVEKLDDFKTDEEGRVITEVKNGTVYNLIAKKANYLNGSAKVIVQDYSAQKDSIITINVEIALDKLVTNKEIALENIYYDFDKWDIRNDAKPSLDILAEIINNNPDLKIDLGSHTDCQGNDAYNQNLSLKRAQSAINYIKSKGVSVKNVSPVGYGESNPVVNCVCADCKEEQHQSNRRTTFKIID